MAYKTILVCLTNAANAERLVKAASTLARKFDAHLIGLHVQTTLRSYSAGDIDLPTTASRAYRQEQLENAKTIQSVFEQNTCAEDFVSEWRLAEAEVGELEECLVEHALCSDLVIMGQTDHDKHRSNQTRAQEAVIRRSGRPVFILPSVGRFEHFGEHVLIGWRATGEASRALHDAIPFAKDGGRATVLWVSSSRKGTDRLEGSARAIAGCLDRHGVKTTVAHWQNSDIAIGDALLNESFERGADMIVTGAFGHSKLYDFVIGATTSNLLEQMTLPVLFSN